jgi:hypothetical protein
MPIPPLDKRGLLPEGIYDAEIGEIMERFAVSPYRHVLFNDFLRFLHQELTLPGLLIYMAGSYLSDKTSPNDIEITLVADQSFIQSFAAQKIIPLGAPSEHERLKAQFRIDFYITFELAGYNDFRTFFQYVGDKTAQDKGIDAKDKRGIIRVIYDNLG